MSIADDKRALIDAGEKLGRAAEAILGHLDTDVAEATNMVKAVFQDATTPAVSEILDALSSADNHAHRTVTLLMQVKEKTIEVASRLGQ